MAEEKITIEDFIKIDLRVGKILHAEEVEDSRKMLKLDVDIGEEKRTIYAGVKKSYAPEELINKLENHKGQIRIEGISSNGSRQYLSFTFR